MPIKIRPKNLISDNNGLLSEGFSDALDEELGFQFMVQATDNCGGFGCRNEDCTDHNCTNAKKCKNRCDPT